MAELIVGLMVILAAIVAVGIAVFRSFSRRLAMLESPADVYRVRYAPPAPDLRDFGAGEVPEPLDVVGAWAAEQAARGERVSDEEIALQRRMRVEAGL